MPELLTLRRLIPGVALLLVAGACSPSPGSAAGETGTASSPEATLPPPDPVSITPVLEEGAAASAILDAEGGIVEAIAPGGTRLALEVPPGVLFTEVEITLTPARAVEGLPLSGNLVGAVDLAPDGLILLRPATLVIESPDLPEEVLAFGWLGDGDDFHLKIFEAEEGRVEIPVTHFSGAGVGGGTSADAEGASEHPPADPDAAYENATAACRASGGPDCMEDLEEAVLAEYYGRVKPMLGAAIQDENQPFRDGIAAWLAWWARMTLLFGSEATLLDEFVESEELGREAFDHAYRRAKERCVTDHDPAQALVMLQLGSAIQLLGWSSESAIEDAGRCMRFKLDFRNEIEFATSAGDSRHVVLARNVLIFPSHQSGLLNLEGEGEINVVEVHSDLYGVAAELDFQAASWRSEPDDFTVERLEASRSGVPSNALHQWEEEELSATMIYDPGRPDVIASFEDLSWSFNESEIGWHSWYELFHDEERDEGSGWYIVVDWEPGSGERLFARADIDRPITQGDFRGSSTSTFELWHEPDPTLAREG